MLLTEECLLSKVQERNKGFKKKDYEDVFSRYLGINNFIWLKKGISGDDTHGHIDDIARFVSKNKIFIHPYDDIDVIKGQGTIATEILKEGVMLFVNDISDID